MEIVINKLIEIKAELAKISEFDSEKFKRLVERGKTIVKQSSLNSTSTYIDEINLLQNTIAKSIVGLTKSRIQELSNILERIIDEIEISSSISHIQIKSNDVNRKIDFSKQQSNKVFIVHGRNDIVKLDVARTIEKLGITAIILHEQINKGNTIIEKFEEHADVGYAIVLLTDDDEGQLIGTTPNKLIPRARQNVILELGYFIGKLGRERVCTLHSKDIEIPSDLHGIVYLPIDLSGHWKYTLAKELKAVGYNIDLNNI